MPSVTLHRFLPQEATEQAFADLIRLSETRFAEDNPNESTLPPADYWRKFWESVEANPQFNPEVYTVRNTDNEFVGMLLLAYPKPDTPEYEAQKHMGFIAIEIMPAYRRQGIGTYLLQKTVERFTEAGLSLIQWETHQDTGRAFSEKFGASKSIEGRESRVYLKDISWEMLSDWITEAETANPTVTLEFYEGYPPEVEAFSELFTEVYNLQPFEELEGGATTWTSELLQQNLEHQQGLGMDVYTMVTREADGAFSGLTQMNYLRRDHPQRIRQGLTGVGSAYRGRGLGKWLKAKMAYYLRENCPDLDYIATANASSNAAMLSINERMGFKLHQHTTFYKLTVEQARIALGLVN